MLEKSNALKAGHDDKASFYQKMVDMFTAQLVESNPILTAISDAMTGEGEANVANDSELAASWAAKKEVPELSLLLAPCSLYFEPCTLYAAPELGFQHAPAF